MSATDLTDDQLGGRRADKQPPVDAWTVMERFYAAEAAYVAAGGFGEASYDDVAVHLDPEVILHQAPGLPFTGTGTWRGHDGMERFLARFSEVWESMEFLEQEHWGDEDTVVVRNRVRFPRPCHRPGSRHHDRATDHRQERAHAGMPPVLLGPSSHRRRLPAR